MKVPKPRRLPSGSWRIQLRLGGESISITAPTEKEVVRQAQYTKAEYLAGRREQASEESGMTLKKGIEIYCADRANGLSPATIRKYENIKKNHWSGLMPRRMDQITKRQWQQAVDAMLASYAVGTVRRSWGMVKTILSYCGVEAPAVAIGKASETKAKTMDSCQFLEPDQILKFVEEAEKSPYCIPLLLALSSLRIAEIDGLDWSNVVGSTVKIRRVRILDKSGAWVYKDGAKTESSVRDVEIQIPALQRAIDAARQPDGKVMTCCQQTLRRALETICTKAGVPNPGVHGLRHSFASLSAHLGIPEIISQEIGGWSNEKIMKEIYTHVARTDLEQSKKKLTEFYAEKPKKPNAHANAHGE